MVLTKLCKHRNDLWPDYFCRVVRSGKVAETGKVVLDTIGKKTCGFARACLFLSVLTTNLNGIRLVL